MKSGILAAAGLSVLLVAQEPPGAIQESVLRAHLAFLSDDLLEGRAMGHRGGELTVAYLETQLRVLGLQPGNGASYRQSIKFTGARALADQSSLRFTGGGTSTSFSCGPEILFNTSTGLREVTLDAPLVFVGYGISAPEENWDDFKGVDVRGKLLVMMVNEPEATKEEPGRFDGQSLTYYGRWSYKFEEAKRRGAVGALLVYTGSNNAYGWEIVQTGHSGERFHLAEEPGGGIPFMGWIQEGNARQLLATSGRDLDALLASARRRTFKPVDLGLTLEGTLVSQLRALEPANVLGLVPGTDPNLKDEVVVYGAHWDHLGFVPGTGSVYNGAVDNASGCAALLAMAAQAVRHPGKRTQMFLFPCGEEAGLLGAAGYISNPPVPLEKTVAMLNMDCLNFAGRTRDIGLQGAERSTLGELGLKVAQGMGLKVRREPPDAQGLYFRADHFAFAKAGIPAFTLTMVMGAGGEWDFLDPSQRTRAEAYVKGQYHTSKDRYDPAWDLAGMIDQAQFLLNLGRVLADQPGRPIWKAGGPFPTRTP